MDADYGGDEQEKEITSSDRYKPAHHLDMCMIDDHGNEHHQNIKFSLQEQQQKIPRKDLPLNI